MIFLYTISTLGKSSRVITAENPPWWQKVGLFLNFGLPISSSREQKEILDKNFPLPTEEENRWDVLILGIRGSEDPDGGLLSDSILLFSLNKETGKSGLTSIPRDIYAEMPGLAKGKVNEIYEKGIARRKALDFSKEAFSRLTAIYIDNVIIFDFKAFREIVDALEGIDLNLKKPFEEKNQWGYEFSLPVGPNHLNGQEALYFVRSRYSTSDFDRSLRQQQVILAIKNKAFSAGILSNPLKLGPLLKSVTKNIMTDLNIFDTGHLIKLANSFNPKENEPALGHLSTNNILDQTFQDDIYILRPKNNDWQLFRKYFKDILN
ncbi:MAG: cell envelope-related transcriptional attenuator [Parcubacteria group bacterium Gr01-1014_44]|nr:MAG: cell envelope-related transcriptional attenuator [Parcubacteria group bacterium Gr01-1014_44]